MSRANVYLCGLAMTYVAMQIASGYVPPYGLFHDEFYYWAGAQRLGFGYVDHPPFSVWMLWLSSLGFGDSRFGLGLIPALCGGGVVFLTGLMARRFGAGEFGQMLAALCTVTAPLALAFFSFYSVNAFEFLFWTLACFLLIELIKTHDERYWVALGLLAGIALLNKHTFALLLGALGVGIVASPIRTHLRSRWLWLGGLVAIVVASPNLIWNALNDWPSLTFYQSVGAEKNLPTSLGEAFGFQVVGLNPATAFIWIAGLLSLLFSSTLRAYRPLGIAFAFVFLVMLFSGQRRGDRILGAYPVVFAAGAAFWERWTDARPRLRPFRLGLPGLVLTMGVALLPVSLPIFAPTTVAAFFEAIGESPEIETGDVGNTLPLTLMGRLEWERFANEVGAAVETLTPEERARAVILTPRWVSASAIEYFMRDREMPPVVSPQNAYWLWRNEAIGRDLVLSVGIRRDSLAPYFEYTRPLAEFTCEYCAEWRRDMEISLSSGPIRPIEQLLTEWRTFGAGRPAAFPE